MSTSTLVKVKIDGKAVNGVIGIVANMLKTVKHGGEKCKIAQTGLDCYYEKGADYIPLECLQAMKKVSDVSTFDHNYIQMVNHILDDLINNCLAERGNNCGIHN